MNPRQEASIVVGLAGQPVMGARVIEARAGRLLTILLAPIVPCSARMAVLAFLAPAFFGDWALAVIVALVAANLVVLAAVGGDDRNIGALWLPRRGGARLRTAVRTLPCARGLFVSESPALMDADSQGEKFLATEVKSLDQCGS
ncbi:MAG TPA: hypothetical protein VIE89_06760 [Candidatus Binatia bacterium]|jgi:hypothetical protein